MIEPVLNKKNIAVYTCIFDGYDSLEEPQYVDPLIDYYFIGDFSPPHGSCWRRLQVHTNFSDPSVANRYYKMHPHELFSDYEISIYIDGNIKLISSPREIAFRAMSVASLSLYQHFSRSCVYSEAEVCAALGHEWFWRVNRQMRRYRRENYPADNGLYEANVIIRRHNDLQIINLMKLWWYEYLHGIKRDQISLPFLLWKTSTVVYSLGPSDHRNEKKIFSLGPIHQRKLSTRLRGFVNRNIVKL